MIAATTLADLCTLVTDGTHDTPKRVEQGFPLIKAKEIVGGTIDFETCDQISEKDHLRVIARSNPERGDTLFAHIGASLGEAAYVKTNRPFSIKNIALFKPDPAKIDGRYLYYLVIGPAFQGFSKAAKTGSAQPFLGLAQLRAHPVRYHKELPEQRRIASILGAYDDLIEVNRRRIAVLEEMARRLFDEWFTCDEPTMKSWPPRILSDIIEFDKGRKPSTSFDSQNDQTIPQILIDVLRGGSPKFVELDRMVIARADDTIMVMDGSGSSEVFIGHVGAIGSTLGRYRCRPDVTLTPYWLYLLFASKMVELKSKNTGAAVPHANKDYISRIAFREPPEKLSERFHNLVKPKFEMVATLAAMNTRLAASRNFLLPRLISGEVSVLAGERELEGVA